MASPLHVAIVSTGRSGTTWLQLLLAHLYAAQPVEAPNWDDEANHLADGQPLDSYISSLPERAIIHAHWHAYPDLVRQLHALRLPTVTLARNPLDVLISHLAWVNRNTTDDLGLDMLKGATPTSRAFVDFATGELSQWLLSITPGWWLDHHVIRVRYEDLRADPQKELARITAELSAPPIGQVDEALAVTDLPRLRDDTPNSSAALARVIDHHRRRKHFWQGRPNLWRSFLPAAQAEEIAAAHRPSLDLLSYPIDPDPALTRAQAESNWRALL